MKAIAKLYINGEKNAKKKPTAFSRHKNAISKCALVSYDKQNPRFVHLFLLNYTKQVEKKR